MKKLWLGRYISVPSFYHSLDSRAKLLMMVLNIIMMICISRWIQLLLAACLIFMFLYLSKIPFREDIRKRYSDLFNYTKVSSPRKVGDYYFYYKS